MAKSPMDLNSILTNSYSKNKSFLTDLYRCKHPPSFGQGLVRIQADREMARRSLRP